MAKGASEVDCASALARCSAAWFYVAPEAKVGFRVSERLELSAGLEGLVMIGPKQPSWNAETSVYAGSYGNGSFPAQTLLEQTVIVIAPGLSVRYDF